MSPEVKRYLLDNKRSRLSPPKRPIKTKARPSGRSTGSSDEIHTKYKKDSGRFSGALVSVWPPAARAGQDTHLVTFYCHRVTARRRTSSTKWRVERAPQASLTSKSGVFFIEQSECGTA